MRTYAAFIAALAIHVAAVAIGRAAHLGVASTPRVAAVEPSDVDPEIEVALVDITPVIQVPVPAPRVSKPTTIALATKPSAAIAASSMSARTSKPTNGEAFTATASITAPTNAGETRGTSPLMKMRGADLALSTEAAERIAGPGVGTPSAVPTGTGGGELHPSGRGTYTSDLGTGLARVATAHVARDGTVHFDDAADFDIHVCGIGVCGKSSFDDWIMRRHGIDPYASAKRAWLDRTRDQRAEIGARARTEDLAHSPLAMQRNLAAVWGRLADPIARKQAIFELWDEVAETGDAALVDGGAAARRYLVGFVRAHLPVGATGSFTVGELAVLNAHRRSIAAFAPYE
jgi:hypothetical protein